MFFFPSFLMTDEERKARAKWTKEEKERRLPLCVPWDPKVKWEPELNIKADSYPVRHLFEGVAASSARVDALQESQFVDSPDGNWRYCVKLIPRGEKLDTWYGSKTGSVLFDGPVHIPAVHQKQRDEWEKNPWMSLTPGEIISMRGGLRRAKGRTIVAGLGLGHLLIDVSMRKQVTSLVLVEKSQQLVDWVLPRVKPFMRSGLEVEVVIGDAMKEMPKLSADVALVDIFDTYGNNDWERDQLRRECKNIGYIWVWGAAVTNGDGW